MSYLYCPEVVWDNDRLNLTEKCLLGMIIALSNKYGYCNATNDYFQKQLQINKSTISFYISKLTSIGYIQRILIYSDENKNQIVERRLIFQFDRQKDEEIDKANMIEIDTSDPNTPIRNLDTPYSEFPNTPFGNSEGYNIYNNELSKDNSMTEVINDFYGIENLGPPLKKKVSRKISTLDKKINTAIIVEMKHLLNLTNLPMSVGQQRIFANLIRKRIADAIPQESYCEQTILQNIKNIHESMSKDTFLRAKMGDLRLFYYKMILHSPLFVREAKKEVYL